MRQLNSEYWRFVVNSVSICEIYLSNVVTVGSICARLDFGMFVCVFGCGLF